MGKTLLSLISNEAFLGSLIGGLFTLLAVSVSYRQNIKRETEREMEEVKRFIVAIHEESSALWDRYRDVMGGDLDSLNEKKFIDTYWSVTQDYFVIYRQNANLIGKVQNDKLRKYIVRTYISAKNIVDDFNMNNEALREWQQYKEMSKTGSSDHTNRASALESGLVDYARKIKEDHEVFSMNYKTLMEEIKKYR